MLPKINRLTSKEFDDIFKNNKRFFSKDLTLFGRLDSNGLRDYDNQQLQFAVVVSKKKYKRRVDRNYIRRVIYRALYDVIKNHPVTKSGIIMPNKTAINLINDQGDIQDQIKELLL